MANGHNMHWIKNLQIPVFFLDDKIVPSDENKLRVRHRIFIPIRSANDMRPAFAEMLPNEGNVHAMISPFQARFVNEPALIRCD